MKQVIVSRHPATIEWLRKTFDLGPEVPVVAQATIEDVEMSEVFGNLPMYLASRCTVLNAVEFTGQPPRGAEYGIKEMEAAGVIVRRYVVAQL